MLDTISFFINSEEYKCVRIADSFQQIGNSIFFERWAHFYKSFCEIKMLRIHIHKRTIRGLSLVLFVLLFRSLKEFWLPSLKHECLQHVFTPGWSWSLCRAQHCVRPSAAESHSTVITGKSVRSFENLDWWLWLLVSAGAGGCFRGQEQASPAFAS